MATKFEKYGCATFAVLLAAGGLGAAFSDAPVEKPQLPDERPTVAADKKPVESAAVNVSAPTRSIHNDPRVAEAQHAVAGLINLNGHLCAKVENVQPLQMREQVFEVTCIEYRGGSGKVRYLVDGATGTASRL